MNDQKRIREALYSIDPASLTYQEWVEIGMALKHEGFTAHEWDEWSAKDAARYHDGECYSKWDTFKAAGATVVTGGTIFELAKQYGQTRPRIACADEALDWDSFISEEGYAFDPAWIEEEALCDPGSHWNPVQDFCKYIDLLFEPEEYVPYVVKSCLHEDGKYKPADVGIYTRTASSLIQDARRYNDLRMTLGDWDSNGGAWIRFNPHDGKGVKNENVTSFRYALVESDSDNIEKQYALIKALELPAAAVVYSGGKSVHAIVRVEADNAIEYRKRVDYLYETCEKYGLQLDKQNKNPSRLSRLPGADRRGQKQYLINTNLGKKSFVEWRDWIEEINDNMGDPELPPSDDLRPRLADELIEGVLRKGHKMLVAGPSKAGKSFLLLGLGLAIARGEKWLGRFCARGKVLYVNLELDHRSCWARVYDILEQDDLKFSDLHNQFMVWNLRGKSVPMDRLARKLIRRAEKECFDAIIIDPIYKVLTGDENNAADMALFCNQFDRVATELGCAVIYCHHHSKGYQGGKRSMDRASGSGVFARDPDALLDMTELEVKPSERDDYAIAPGETAWRIDGTLREFPSFKPIDCVFRYPIHEVDKSGALAELQPEVEKPSWQRGNETNKERFKEKRKREEEDFDKLFQSHISFTGNDSAAINDLAAQIGISTDSLRKRINKYKKYTVTRGVVTMKAFGKD